MKNIAKEKYNSDSIFGSQFVKAKSKATIEKRILEDPDFIIKALQTTKKVIKSILLKSQIQQNEIVFDGQKNIQQTLTENILFK